MHFGENGFETFLLKDSNRHFRVIPNSDFLVLEFSKSGGGRHANKSIDNMNNMIWKYNIITLDRLVLCMALRHHEGNAAQVCFIIIQLLLVKPADFRNRVSEFCRTNNIPRPSAAAGDDF